ncbi:MULTISPECIES: maltose alpha-D-glucosyltransferase [unclassified Chelatococcus]|uniref:maltose alpha-D-glucosyltransferase n=1 Tax=unclassified Chelatococcus TaxID=2638111 RepID=UPI001BCACCFF|nr:MULTISPECIES: maltose alpha-D-glucosyltransferase [unclassified Chelatococcus]CAH1654036.1 Trehalose synthase [Hyphomicrobiales bacterium]MBS7742834.1 maltose alpha-D-glucosyltransferase [Chelatococcus sp. HY11]MBX3542048.1 maltose alpha-D-glucosyltransferase [Chelatococcus sp.]MCO5074060.1 maltose alpha-D-glucosyltransferase [Chelatococcus sp.]CAH1694739.1 Trehalose synthase [Hyphomicrobiales bacterium]
MSKRRKTSSLPADPQWYKDAIIYQLHIKSFFDSNNDGVGDFPGLIDKLDYIAGLGVTAIWLLPFYPSPRRDDGYDIAAYRDVHTDYGVMADVKRFIDEAHARGLRVITELVINHTSDQHPWFQKARHAKPGSAARNFYVWSDNDQAYADTRIIFLDTEKSNWTWDPVAGAYYWHRFYSHQPDLNFDNPQVVRAVLSVMRFWLDLGVDGLRLDAVPYLVEREGTINENLPETHAVLKRIRAELDANYPDRMLLAEANQWPEDTQQYFGDGDECHMAFHFPLMPRMYMSIAREDRFPITDILRQTPDIPENCQWAIFLRNHDELTLEMVTDSERDYLWQVYASDRRARINLGIRRRLAPLLERDRRRIELMNALLQSMPGTPVIYYGDEIGMGDNIHLGDRDGVRTPMQWSADRNGGFSRADPEQLVLPPIMDTLYGFEAINVEAQNRDPHSLLNWMRRMLATRRKHAAFGRGTLRFLYPRNRKILAYLREYQDETILCVANLSRSPQAVELDLSAFVGRIPVEMTADSVFPPIGQLTYLLTLPPFGFYWFLLATETNLPSWHVPAPEPLPEFATIVLRHGLDELLNKQNRRVIETEALPAYLQKRRWFAGKDEPILKVEIASLASLARTPDTVMTEIDVTTAKGTARYLLPMGVVWEDEAGAPLPQQLALARLRRGRRVGYLTDAFVLDPFIRSTITALVEARRAPLGDGEVRFIPTARLAEVDVAVDAPLNWLSAEQSNSSVIVGDELVAKLIRRQQPGIHPEAEMNRRLTELGFRNSAPLLGEVVKRWGDREDQSATIAIVQGFIRNQGDGWHWTLDFIKRNCDEAVRDESMTDEELLRPYRVLAAALGHALANMHDLLAQPSDDPAFAPVIVGEDTTAAWASSVIIQIERACAIIEERRDWASEADRLSAAQIIAHRSRLIENVRTLATAGVGALQTRIHGDFHLGQVLIAQQDVFIVDFEGEPSRSLVERRAKASRFRDVAGLLRSFDYAAAVAGRTELRGESTDARKQAFIEKFRKVSGSTFLAVYQGGSLEDGEDGIGRIDARQAALTDLFTLEKAAYELCYEAANRPNWIDIPLQALAALVTRLVENPVREHA